MLVVFVVRETAYAYIINVNNMEKRESRNVLEFIIRRQLPSAFG